MQPHDWSILRGLKWQEYEHGTLKPWRFTSEAILAPKVRNFCIVIRASRTPLKVRGGESVEQMQAVDEMEDHGQWSGYFVPPPRCQTNHYVISWMCPMKYFTRV